MSHDSQAQLLGPLVLVNVEGMSRCQHRVFQSFEVHYRTSISIEELHEVSTSFPAWAEMHDMASSMLRRAGVAIAGPKSLCVRLHALSLESACSLFGLTRAEAALRVQLDRLVRNIRAKRVDEASIGAVRLQLGVPSSSDEVKGAWVPDFATWVHRLRRSS